MDAQTQNFVNLACDFREYWKTDKNPLLWTKEERQALINEVSTKEPDKFTRYGYFLGENRELYWSTRVTKINRKYLK